MREVVRVFLFNLHILNRGVPRVLPELLGEAGGPDVMLWNEVPPGGLPKLLAATGGRWATVEGPSALFLGVAPFRMSMHVREGAALTGLEQVASLGLAFGRRALVARVYRGERSILLVNTHLTAELPFVAGARFFMRAKELTRLAGHLRALRGRDEPILLGGDFNFVRVRGDEVEQRWAADFLGRELDLVDVARERAGAGGVADTWPSQGHWDAGLGAQRMDLFYLSRSWMPRVRDLVVHAWPWRRSGSDHNAVSLVLDLEG